MARFPKNTVYIYYYSKNTGDPFFGSRVLCSKSFAKVYNEMAEDVGRFLARGAEVLDQYVNNVDLEHATMTNVTLRLKDGSILDLHIDPAAY